MKGFTLLRFHTAATLGMTVRDLDNQMTGTELLQWGKYFEHVNGVGSKHEEVTEETVLQEMMKLG